MNDTRQFEIRAAREALLDPATRQWYWRFERGLDLEIAALEASELTGEWQYRIMEARRAHAK